MNLLDPHLLWPIAGAIAAGVVIGAEREYRASPAGLRTHVLVSLSCCLLMLSAVHQMAWLNDAPREVVRIDPVRMAHGILTGIGFLCGGVIFREGFNVRGLTTAASLWMTATLGMLFGIGFYQLAVFGAAATLLVLAAVTITERYAPRRRVAHIMARFRKEEEVTMTGFAAMLASEQLAAITIDQRLDGGHHEFSAIVNGYSETRAEALAAKWSAEPSLAGFDIRPQQG
ncbi:putative Mg2+ transporter-C (MgtC) family protein [Sphingopyxis sp. OAS728]|uniref:MgtC/SapB family protein n=1 Tax=Sphingopyxis sp. OAS728 TaxID=2663823 RepID=UPI00178B961F|nr:MgtC/SapB family protein [Sphingopyxis sp. OAS728]MBE1529480.1 putative Mg2+ transporter-C (MgtC) family protein [Sphingopyxis sp. OAS728]